MTHQAKYADIMARIGYLEGTIGVLLEVARHNAGKEGNDWMMKKLDEASIEYSDILGNTADWHRGKTS